MTVVLQRSSATGPRVKDVKLFDTPRNAVTWADDDVFLFGYTSDSGDSPDSTSPKSITVSSSDEDEEIVYENSDVELDEDEYSCEAETTTVAPKSGVGWGQFSDPGESLVVQWRVE